MTDSSNNTNIRTGPSAFFITALLLLAAGMLFGLLGAYQYIHGGFLKAYLSFERVRPLHVSSVVFWIILAACGSVLQYLQEFTGKPLYSRLLLHLQYYLFSFSIIAILITYVLGIFRGREYWEFHPALAIPIATAWILFLINIFRSIASFRNLPVYVWMWLTGAVFFLFTFLESYLWLLPYFRDNIVNDMTIQWKSYGSMVGSWNMLVYGCSIYLLDKISGNKQYGISKIGFAIYFLGLFNLMFNWGHHIYTLPTSQYIKYISYIVSMTELILVFRMILQWRGTLDTTRKHFHILSYRLLIAADIWVLLTLILSIGMSMPAINIYTHGTHVTVGHTMGATIGINSFLLFAYVFDILGKNATSHPSIKRWFSAAYWLANVSLFLFWISLIGAGVQKAAWQMASKSSPFSTMMAGLKPYFIVFFISGLGVCLALLTWIVILFKCRRKSELLNDEQFL